MKPNNSAQANRKNTSANATSHTGAKTGGKNARKPWGQGAAAGNQTAFIDADGAGDSQYSGGNSAIGGPGERVKVAVRCRPLL